MKAMILTKIGKIESSPLQLSELPDPSPGPGEVRLRVNCCGICRTDLHEIEGDIPPPPRLPIVLGHQIVGVVDRVGEGCKRYKPGARVGVAWLRSVDGVCRFCASGRENLCEKSLYTGYHANGGYAQYALAPEDFVYEIPSVFDDTSAAPLLCAGIIGYRALKRGDPPPGGKLAIFGFGSSAAVIIQIAKKRGLKVYVVSRTPGHRKLAERLGADWAGEDFRQAPGNADASIVFAPAGSIVPAALECLDRGGACVLAGIHMSPIPSLDYDRLLFNERDIRPVTANTRQDARDFLAEAAEAGVKPEVTLYELKDANRALQDMKAGKIAGTGVLTV